MAALHQCFSGLLFSNHIVKRNSTEQSLTLTFVKAAICPQISRTLPMSLALKYLLEAAVWAESPGVGELSRVAQTLGHALSKRWPPREDLLCFGTVAGTARFIYCASWLQTHLLPELGG